MEQLIFVGIIVLFTVLEAVARKNRAKQGGGEGVPLPEEPHRQRPEPRPRSEAQTRGGAIPRSYDPDLSVDDATREEEVRRRREPATSEASAMEPARARSGSEGLIPADVWEEIQRMARGDLPEGETLPPPGSVPAPRQPRVPQSRPPGRQKPSPSRPRPSGKAGSSQRAGAPTAQSRTGKGLGRPAPERVEVAPALEGTAGHPIRRASGTAPSQRAGFAPGGHPAAAPARAVAIRRLLTAERASLRQAVILQELLNPPPGLREG